MKSALANTIRLTAFMRRPLRGSAWQTIAEAYLELQEATRQMLFRKVANRG
jgi:hypothetical protein